MRLARKCQKILNGTILSFLVVSERFRKTPSPSEEPRSTENIGISSVLGVVLNGVWGLGR
jgi:hypothetical protein